jgi:hypothetical protein
MLAEPKAEITWHWLELLGYRRQSRYSAVPHRDGSWTLHVHDKLVATVRSRREFREWEADELPAQYATARQETEALGCYTTEYDMRAA